MNNPCILLIDNGSSNPQATHNLRRLAAALSHRSAQSVHPVSLQHADKIAPDQLGGSPAQMLAPFLSHQLAQDQRNFLAIPLFFGVSRALTSFVPNLLESLRQKFGNFHFTLTDVLYPLPQGEPRLARILLDQINPFVSDSPRPRVILLDHGSPLPQVTEVRVSLGKALKAALPNDVQFFQAVMERRQGREYDFNGNLLEHVLQRLAQKSLYPPVALSLLFLSPGRHAGENGDIHTICTTAKQRYPGLQIYISPLVAEHPLLIEILQDRLESGLSIVTLLGPHTK
jgi:sirohydrochlorin ferrochelatase